MTDPGGSVGLRTLWRDESLRAVFVIAGIAAVCVNAVPVALPTIGAAFDLTETQIGLVMSVFSVAVIATHPVVGILADFAGRRGVVIASLCLFGLAGVAVLAVSSFPALLLLRAVQGVAFAGTLPLTATLTGDLYTGTAGSAAQGVRSGLVGLAAAVTPVVAGGLALIAWQYPFALYALTFPTAVLVYWSFPEPVARREREAGGGRWLAELRAYWGGLRTAATPRLAVLLAGGFVLFFLKGGFMTFLPVFVVSGLGSTVTVAGTVLAAYGGGRVVVSPLSGAAVARLGRRPTLLLGVALAVLGIGALPFAATPWALLGATLSYAAGEGLLNPVLNDAVAASSVDAQRAGVMSGLNVLKDGALVVAPVLLGAVIVAAGFTVAFLAAAALGTAYGLVVVFRYR